MHGQAIIHLEDVARSPRPTVTAQRRIRHRPLSPFFRRHDFWSRTCTEADLIFQYQTHDSYQGNGAVIAHCLSLRLFLSDLQRDTSYCCSCTVVGIQWCRRCMREELHELCTCLECQTRSLATVLIHRLTSILFTPSHHQRLEQHEA